MLPLRLTPECLSALAGTCLAGLSDARLADLGLSAADVALIRAHRWPAPDPQPVAAPARQPQMIQT